MKYIDLNYKGQPITIRVDKIVALWEHPKKRKTFVVLGLDRNGKDLGYWVEETVQYLSGVLNEA